MRVLHPEFDKATHASRCDERRLERWRFFSFRFWSEGGLFWGIRSMNWECCIEYFIDCLLARCWPAWHAKFPARWRRHVASHQPSHPWGSPAFPVNKLAHSGGGREARAQGHWGWDEEKTHTHTHTHTHSFSEEQHTQPWLQYELPWSEPDESSESTQWIETTWNLFFNYSFTVYKVCCTKTGQKSL